MALRAPLVLEGGAEGVTEGEAEGEAEGGAVNHLGIARATVDLFDVVCVPLTTVCRLL